MATITTINATDLITNSRTDINTNFANLNTDKIETSVLDTDTTLAANSDAKVATQKAVKAYVDAGGNVNASTTTKGIVEEATQSEVDAGTAAGGTGARLFVNPSTLGGKTKFGGDGTDGALTVSSGTTTIDCGAAAVLIKNYTSISITGNGVLKFTNGHTNGTVVILRSQGAITLSSSATPMIDVSIVGGIGGVAVSAGANTTTSGTNGNASAVPFGSAGGGTNNNTAGVPTWGLQVSGITRQNQVLLRYNWWAPGAGGASGNTKTGSGSTATSGTGGNGCGALIIECNGTFTFTTTGGLSTTGQNGTAGVGTGGTYNSGGGGGGGGGSIFVFYKTAGTISGTITTSASSAGASASAGAPGNIAGSGGGAALEGSGTAGSTGTPPTSGGGAACTIAVTNQVVL